MQDYASIDISPSDLDIAFIIVLFNQDMYTCMNINSEPLETSPVYIVFIKLLIVKTFITWLCYLDHQDRKNMDTGIGQGGGRRVAL